MTMKKKKTKKQVHKPAPKGKSKVKIVMEEFKEGSLKSGGSGKQVTNPKQAIAIALSEQRKADKGKKKKKKALNAAAVPGVMDPVPAMPSATPQSVKAAGAADITALYTARFGALSVGDRIFVEANTMAEGWEGPKLTYTAVVPASP